MEALLCRSFFTLTQQKISVVLKAVLTLALCISFAARPYAQFDKYIVSFTDKNNSPYSISNPAAYLSQKAINRRLNHSIAFDSTDLPVNPLYIAQVLAKGNVRLLVPSKWLNDILVYTKDTLVLQAISTLPFVKKTMGVSPNKAVPRKPATFTEETYFIPHQAFANGVKGDTTQYGATQNQIHIHHGEFLHNKGYTGSGITIAMLDAGFYHYKSLPAFDSLLANQQVLGVKDFVAFDNSVDEDAPHGMECLSTIAANIPGVMVGSAPKASFWLLRSEDAASEYPIEEHNWVTAAEFADSAGADMISSSLGYTTFDNPVLNHSYADFYTNRAMVTRGAALAAKKGLIVTNSAGNSGGDAWKYLVFPADADSVCSVGAVNSNNIIAPFSSYGYPGKTKPNIVSVGEGATVFGVGGTPVLGNGTSFSNPNINGLIACLWQAFPQYDNMAILDAVYQSADKYNNPDNRYGYGLPNMQTAYLILKKKQNGSLYGSNWLFATPNPFTDSLHVKLIGQENGTATITLNDADGNTVATIHLTTETAEVYDTAFTNLASYPAGSYTATFTGNGKTNSVTVFKKGIVLSDWIQAMPVPFNQQLTVYLKAPETGSISLQLIDADGRVVSAGTLYTQKGNIYTVPFTNTALPRGAYFIRYNGVTQKRTIKVIKN